MISRSFFLGKTFVIGILTGFLMGYTAGTFYGKTHQTQIQTQSTQTQAKKVKLALLLDTSSSMDGLINQAKAQLWNIVNELNGAKCDNTEVELQIALYEYGKSSLPASEGYIRMVTPLTNDLDQVSKDLFELRTNGGDEFCGAVIDRALSQLDWSESNDDLKIMFIAGNEPFTQGNVHYVTACQKAAEQGIVVNTIYCGDFSEGERTQWRHGAQITAGSYFSIDHNKISKAIETPYDDDIVSINQKMNDTYLSYGTAGATYMANQHVQDANASSVNKDVIVKRSVSKTGNHYKKGAQKWDLTSKYDSDSTYTLTIANELEDLDESQVSEELVGKSGEERFEIIQEKKKEREKLETELLEINKKRQDYIAENTKVDEKGELENAMLNALREQAKKKSIQLVN